ncbi:MAG: hypothetical protein ABI873_12115 [Marmoricola sp.]
MTKEVAGAEAAIRKVWGGSLCVSGAKHTEADLRRILRRIEDRPDLLSAGLSTGGVEMTVTDDDGTLQLAMDEVRQGHGAGRIGAAAGPRVAHLRLTSSQPPVRRTEVPQVTPWGGLETTSVRWMAGPPPISARQDPSGPGLWPDDQAWFLATEIDLCVTVVGAAARWSTRWWPTIGSG